MAVGIHSISAYICHLATLENPTHTSL